MADFVAKEVAFTKAPENQSRSIRSWHKVWRQNGKLEASKPGDTRKGSMGKAPYAKRQRRTTTQGAVVACPMVREALYEWFVSMRYCIDWKALKEQRCKDRSCGQRKAIGRFPRSLLLAKVWDLLEQYTRTCLVQGVKPRLFKPTSRWFKAWQSEYGLSMRRPNRKYKCPRHVVAERMRLWWISVFRIRALCMEVFGYDPEIENWDQSPFHNNESGSQGTRTLSVKGALRVP